MIEVDIYKENGQKGNKLTLASDVFGKKLNEDLLHQVIVAQAANKRAANAHTKTRGEVRGGGAKPWRQKGTGRARAGSNRSPIWRGGGITFGPRNNRNYKKKIPHKIKKQATCMALSSKVDDKEFIVLEKIIIREAKTREIIKTLDKLPIEGTILMVLSEPNIIIQRASRNISYLKTLSVSTINPLDILSFKYLIITKDAIKILEEKYSNKVNKTESSSSNKVIIKNKKQNGSKTNKKDK